jgi:hypothetical protein
VRDLLGLPLPRRRADDATIQRLASAANAMLLKADGLEQVTTPQIVLKPLTQALEALRDAGGAVEALTLWADALPLLNRAAAEGDRDAIASAAAPCVAVIAGALPETGWPLLTQMRWVLSAEMSDPADLLAPLSDPFWAQDIPPDAWLAFARDLAHLPPSPALIEARVDALQNAGLTADAIALRRAHLDSPRALTHLIQLQCDQGDLPAAEAEAEEALRHLISQPKATQGATLQARLLGIIHALAGACAKLSGEDAAAARVAWRWHAFALKPDATSARALLQAAQVAGCEAAIYAAASAYLLAGEWPKPKQWPPQVALRHWLRPTAVRGLPLASFPLSTVLLDLALESGDPEAIFLWLQRARRAGPISYAALTRAADRLTHARPKEAASLWLEAALAAITRGAPDADLLTPIQRLRPLLGPSAWTAHVRSLLRQHQHRPRVVLLLNQALMGSP